MAQIRWYGLPALYDSGLRFRREVCRAPGVPGACERFLTAAQALAERGAEFDCDDIAPWRAAELRLAGEHARAIPVRSPEVGWHIVVRRGDGSMEDPSRVLGMGAA